MKRAQGSREHLSQRQPHLAAEHTRGLLGRWLERGQMIADQHRALGRRILDEPGVTMPRRSTDPYDPSNQERMLRGIPVQGYGGAIGGTRPGRGKRLDDWSGRSLSEEEEA